METESTRPQSDALEEACQLLKSTKLKRTNVRLRLVELLLQAMPRALSVKEIHGHCFDSKPDLATIYRNVETLTSVEILKRVSDDHGKALYTIHRSSTPSLSLTCRSCHSVEESPFSIPSALEKEIAALGYSELQSSYKAIGLCRDCSTTD